MNACASVFQQAATEYIDRLSNCEGEWLTEQRQAATQRFAELGFPHAGLEAWRYTSIEGLLQQDFKITHRTQAFLHHEMIQQFLGEPVAARLVFVDGIYQPNLSVHTGQTGLSVGSLHAAMAAGDRSVLRGVGSLSGIGDHGFAALNMATLQDGAVIQVSTGVAIRQPIELLHMATKGLSGQVQHTRHRVVLEAGASVNLVERYLSLDSESNYFNNMVCEISLGEGASLVHQRAQEESLTAYHLCDVHLDIQGDAHYQGVNAALGGAWSRTTFHARFVGEGANCELDGLYLAGEGQLTDFHLNVDHSVAHCESRENFKGILYGAGKAVFDGLIHVREQAQKSQAHLYNANLMLSRRAEVDTKPQLVILADDVKCSHGTTVGQLDDQALFYLRSRGLDKDQAKRLLCLGFTNEIVDRFQSEYLRDHLREEIVKRMSYERQV
ncbi:MAG: Fe-S cluster assembly protein SufD [Candidatus Thiodiazotropha sp. (ex Ustalcina ferruginea)]|nr:Fe-S cluster assembly protein SufD [Candidatus Thiodiazotropha sp. (ex Ustalcina ferruginea)]